MDQDKKRKIGIKPTEQPDPLVDEVYNYLTKFDFPLAVFIQRRFKIGLSRAEKILKQIEEKKKLNK